MIAEMIAETKDSEFIKHYYLNKDYIKKINFQEEDLILLAAASKNKNIVMSYFTDRQKNERLSEIFKHIVKIDGWTFKEDTTIDEIGEDKGVEVTSPVLYDDNEQTTAKIKNIVGMLNKAQQYTDSSCGGHIHIGADYITSVQAFNNLKEIWANNEKIFYIISNKEGELPREGIEDFAAPISQEMESELEETIQINDEDDLDNFKRNLAKKQKDRYKGINFKNLKEQHIVSNNILL